MINDKGGETLLTTTYFGPVEWYRQLYRSDRVLLEACESFTKQTYRNRCVIATANGPQALTVPVEHGGSRLIRDIRISNHGSWRRVHWNALQSSYSESPFFEYYADDLRPFFEQDYEFLYDFNFEIMQKVCELLDIHPHVEHTTTFNPSPSTLRSALPLCSAKNSQLSTLNSQLSTLTPYWQVFAHKFGFQPNLSILDLLFCMGPEGIFWL